ncbi:hypothetical protein CL620_03010, partial [archaeon]|nr:hypothetical protein [archaeon]
MEYRKLIAFGKNSFVISLPKAWVRQNKLVKGDLIYVEESGHNLLLSSKDISENKTKLSIVLNVDGKTFRDVQREVCALYIQNYSKIVLKGQSIKNNIKDYQRIVQNLIALEIMEQTSDSLIAQDFLNMDQVSVYELLRKMDIVTRTMFKEMCSIFANGNYENLNERDHDVNRLYFLLYRAVLYNLATPSKGLKNLKMSPIDLHKIHFIAFYVEAIADEVRRIARFAYELHPKKDIKEEFSSIFEDLSNFFIGSMKSYYTKDQN